ncbi:hypothetical protein SCLCIDRAFT_668817 [Scleroderma citrinum Foug A]|uniref:Uncharacterized protein n=1 Tax=Scleroderma citrinum Foug A TaxID=1036808 RepID=A0A0C3D460_9AGAM|nr:hypothetical protein SCLCIDRAFT_668817 [Scleroderma citrinum Foug A]
MSTSSPTPVLCQPTSYQLPPPPIRPKIEVDPSRLRPTSPFEEEDSLMGTVGLELTVFGLEHVSPDSARDHLMRILNELRNQYEFPPVNVRKADASSTLDYAYITLSSSVTSPRPDILEDLRLILNTLPNIYAIWRVCSGRDRTRRVFFSFSTDGEARSMLTPLREWFGARRFAIMAERITHPPSDSQTRISFDLFRESDVEQVLQTPPFLRGSTLCPGRPRYIIPKYGGEVAIGGIAGLGNLESCLNHHIQRDFGQDAIAYSRIELEDDVYCVIFKDWTTTQDFLKKTQDGLPAGWFTYGATIGKPTLLFSFNTQEAPPNPITRPASTASIESPVQVQFDAFRNEALQFTSTLNAALDRISLVEERQERNNQKLSRMIAAQFLIGDLNSDLLSHENEVHRLNDRYDRCQEQLCSLSGSSSDAHQQLTSSMQVINERRQVVSKEVESLRSEVRAIRHKLLSDSQLTLPSPTSTVTSSSLIRQHSPSSEGDQLATPWPFKDNGLMCNGLKSPSPVLG